MAYLKNIATKFRTIIEQFLFYDLAHNLITMIFIIDIMNFGSLFSTFSCLFCWSHVACSLYSLNPSLLGYYRIRHIIILSVSQKYHHCHLQKPPPPPHTTKHRIPTVTQCGTPCCTNNQHYNYRYITPQGHEHDRRTSGKLKKSVQQYD